MAPAPVAMPSAAPAPLISLAPVGSASVKAYEQDGLQVRVPFHSKINQ